MKIKEIGFVAIPVTDMTRARSFYEEVLIDTGLTKSNMAKRDELAAEARELTLIFSAIISKSGRS